MNKKVPAITYLGTAHMIPNDQSKLFYQVGLAGMSVPRCFTVGHWVPRALTLRSGRHARSVTTQYKARLRPISIGMLIQFKIKVNLPFIFV